MTGKLGGQIPAHVPTIHVTKGESGYGVVTAGQGNPLVRNVMALVLMQYLFCEFGPEGEVIFGSDEKMRTRASLETINKEPGTDGCPTLTQVLQGNVAFQTPADVSSGKSCPDHVGKKG